MVFFVLISKLPLIKVNSPADLVKQNQINLALGVTLYLAVGGLIFFKKVPLDKWLSFIPDKKYLFGIILLDLILYFLLYRFEHGFMPPFNIESIPLPPPLRLKNNKPKTNKSNTGKSHTKTENKKTLDVEDDVSTLSSELRDDLDSTLMRPINKESEQNDSPKEASLSGQDYFKEEKAVVENWDLDEFTQEEYVPENGDIDHAGSMDDEMILER